METANPEQAEAWNGDEGEDWVRHAPRYERSGVHHRPYLINREVLSEDDRVLDIGCGTGRSTIEAARLVDRGHVVGVDLSGPMLAYARDRAVEEGITNASFLQADAQIHEFDAGGFDVAISETGCMFFGDPTAAFTNIGRALRSGGRIALLAWREPQRNEWLSAIRGAVALGRELPLPPADAPGHPFSLADPDRVRSTLTAAGFEAIAFLAVDEPMVLGDDADDAFDFFGSSNLVQWLLEGVDEVGRGQAMDNLRNVFEQAETPAGVLLGTSAWVIRAARS